MAASSGFKRKVFLGVAMAMLLGVTGIAGLVISTGCGEIKTTPIDPDVVEKGAISLKLEPAATSVAPGKTLDIAVKAYDVDGSPMKDGSVVSLENDSLGTVTHTSAPTTGGIAHATFKAGATTGTSKITASIGGASKTVSIRIDTGAPPPPGPVTGDEIPISSITFFDPSPANFKVTATLSRVSVRAPGGSSGPVTVCWDWTHPRWNTYDAKSVTGNMIIIAKINGRWCGGTWEMMAPKLDNHACRTTEALPGQPPFIQSNGPTNRWYPQSGEKIGHMITTITRGGIPRGSQNERTPIVVTTWP